MTIELTQEQFEIIREQVIGIEHKRIIDKLVSANCIACDCYDESNPNMCIIGNSCGTKETINIIKSR